MPRVATAVLASSVLAGFLAGCDEERVAPPVCHAPALAVSQSATPYVAARDAAQRCVRDAAFVFTAAGEAVTKIPADAVARCRREQAALLVTLAGGGRIWPDQKKQTHDDLLHLASLTAIQARSIGCGHAPGHGPETLLTSDTPS